MLFFLPRCPHEPLKFISNYSEYWFCTAHVNYSTAALGIYTCLKFLNIYGNTIRKWVHQGS